ncbi:hypothetical protein Aple_096290 [Acrocarpospora pleiomorpha]|uniref:Uncharacterized protein n=1 Tax=Acrocarpospora pleiomorpha TaxID=90975 RepID=A0A5M3Y0G4_9ACTN|nr:hypothetical protein Aple_096290 [Acrocarpospora pleiomorpha]
MRGTERAFLGGGKVCAGLPVAGDGHPFIHQRVITHLRRERTRGEITLIWSAPVSGVGTVEVEQFTTIGEVDEGLLHNASLSGLRPEAGQRTILFAALVGRFRVAAKGTMVFFTAPLSEGFVLR